MIQQIALKHKLWVKVARDLCKDSMLAEDLVSDMYLKLLEKNLLDNKEQVNDFYIICTIRSIFINQLKKEEKIREIEHEFYGLNYNDGTGFDDFDVSLKSPELPDCLTWVEKQILILRQSKSGREIEQQYHINYQKVHRIENKAKDKLKEWASNKSMAQAI